MSVVKNLSLENIRSHNKFNVKLSPTVTVIVGGNGSGKTSIIEAIYIALQGSSFKGSDHDVLRYKSPWWRINMEFDNYTKRSVTYNPDQPSSKKKIVIGDKTAYRMLPKYKYPVVLFDPDDLRLLHGSPSRRRQFIDRFISQLDPAYQSALHKYERALRQRNNLLKRGNSRRDELFVWDIALSEYGAYIIEKRIAFVERINSKLNDQYNSIAMSHNIATVHYSNTYIGDIKQKLLNDLHAHLERDKILGFTSSGPHRHDVIFRFNNYTALDVASRGEVRTIVLAIKFMEVEIIKQITQVKPIILLDDVFSELDGSRRKAITKYLKDYQTIITTTDADVIVKDFKKSVNVIKLD